VVLTSRRTQVCLDTSGTKLLSASLDRHVKVFDTTDSYRVLHSMKYPEAVLAMALSVSLSPPQRVCG
jgi:hypothetical protein